MRAGGPRISAGADADRERARALVAVSEGDPLAPFALRPEKRYVFSADGCAAIGYLARLGVAVASGDPVGDPASWASAVEEFMIAARAHRRRVAVLGAGEAARELWARHGLRAVPIGRDVVVKGDTFDLAGRRFRNLRQAIQRTRNAGVTVEFWREGALPGPLVTELRALLHSANKVDNRGFSMILGRLFDGSQPDAVVAIARNSDGRVVAAHRYLRAGARDLSLDLPIRAAGSPNGVDERIIAEVVDWGSGHGIERVSLAFAPFPDLFARRAELGPFGKLAYHAVHLLDPLISVERLYRYLRKFHAFDQQRYVMLRWRNVVRVAVVLLLFEFS